MAVFANIGGWIADTLVSKGLSVTTVRKARTIYNTALFCEHTCNVKIFSKWRNHLHLFLK